MGQRYATNIHITLRDIYNYQKHLNRYIEDLERKVFMSLHKLPYKKFIVTKTYFSCNIITGEHSLVDSWKDVPEGYEIRIIIEVEEVK